MWRKNYLTDSAGALSTDDYAACKLKVKTVGEKVKEKEQSHHTVVVDVDVL